MSVRCMYRKVTQINISKHWWYWDEITKNASKLHYIEYVTDEMIDIFAVIWGGVSTCYGSVLFTLRLTYETTVEYLLCHFSMICELMILYELDRRMRYAHKNSLSPYEIVMVTSFKTTNSCLFWYIFVHTRPVPHISPLLYCFCQTKSMYLSCLYILLLFVCINRVHNTGIFMVVCLVSCECVVKEIFILQKKKE